MLLPIFRAFAVMIATTIGCAVLEYAFVSSVYLQGYWLVAPFAFLLIVAFLIDVQRRNRPVGAADQVRQLPYSEMYETLWLRSSLMDRPDRQEHRFASRSRSTAGRASR